MAMYRKDSRRDRIMTEAADHFMREGFERTSIDQIAAGAKVSKQTIYDYFTGKEDLFQQVVRAEIQDSLAQAAPLSGDVPSIITQFAIELSNGFVRPRNFGLFRANLVATRRFPALASALHESRRGASRNLADFLEGAAVRGEIEPFDCSAIDLATRLGGTAIDGTRYFLGSPIPPAQERIANARVVSAIFLRGYRGVDPGPSSAGALETPLVIAAVPNEKVRMRLSAERFDGLCAAALAEFLDSGFPGASMDRISKATGIGRSTIYRQFGDKEGLFRFVVARKIGEVRTEIFDSIAGNSFEDRVADLALTVLNAHLRPDSVAMHHLLIQEAIAFPDLSRSYYDALLARAGRPFSRLAEEQDGIAPSPEAIRAFYTMATFGVRFIASLDPVDDHQRMLLSRQAAELICRGILPAT